MWSSWEYVRTAELVGSLSLATDLAMGLPLEHGLESAVIATRLARSLGVDDEVASQGLSTAACSTTSAAPPTPRSLPSCSQSGTMLENFNPAIYGSSGEVVRGIVRSISPTRSPAGSRGRFQVARTLPRAMRGHPIHMAAMCEVRPTCWASASVSRIDPHGLFGQPTEHWDGKGRLFLA